MPPRARGSRTRTPSSAGLADIRDEIGADAALRRARREVPDQEHHRLLAQRVRRLRGSGRHPPPPPRRLGGDARVHRRDHLPHRRRTAAQGERARVLPRHRRRGARDAAPLRRPGPAVELMDRASLRVGGGEAGHARELRGARRGRGARCSSRRARRTRPRSRRRIAACGADGAGRDALPGGVHARQSGVRAALGRAARPLPGGRRGAPHRDHGRHRGRGVPDRSDGGRHGRPAPAARASTATATRSSSGTRSTGTCTSSSPQTSATSRRCRDTRASWTTSARWSRGSTTDRSRPSTAPAGTWRRSSSSSGARRRTASCGA